MTTLISFGSSPVMGKNSFPGIIAQRLGYSHVDRGRASASNSKITRTILNYKNYKNYTDFVAVVAWTSTARYEFRTEHGWNGFNISRYKKDPDSFRDHWFNGPGKWEYTAITTALKEILIAQTFLLSKKIPYLFVFDMNEIIDSYLFTNPDDYLGSMIAMIDWNRFLLFDNNGFKNWAIKNNFEHTDDKHPGYQAHKLAADYILERFKF